MSFNTSKCHVLHFGENNLCFGYTLNDLPLEAVHQDRDLGVLVDEKLKIDSLAASSANQTLGTIKRTISSHSPGVMITLYKALVQPKLEVGITLASPFYKKDKFILKAVQKQAKKLICKFQTVAYCERLCCLKLPCLTYRPKHRDVMTAFKLIVINIVPDLFLFPPTSSTRCH